MLRILVGSEMFIRAREANGAISPAKIPRKMNATAKKLVSKIFPKPNLALSFACLSENSERVNRFNHPITFYLFYLLPYSLPIIEASVSASNIWICFSEKFTQTVSPEL